jgi:16S rRNA (guanine527-N7)-methyltransferase
VRFILSESVGKKARFVQTAVTELGLPNVALRAVRAEEILLKLPRSAGSTLIITGRAAPVLKAAVLFAPELRAKRTRALFYKGPGLAQELAEAASILKRHKIRCTVLETYNLPDQLGSRSILEMVLADVAVSPGAKAPPETLGESRGGR